MPPSLPRLPSNSETLERNDSMVRGSVGQLRDHLMPISKASLNFSEEVNRKKNSAVFGCASFGCGGSGGMRLGSKIRSGMPHDTIVEEIKCRF